MEKITECKNCKSNNIKLKANEGENILSADKVEIVCADCQETLGTCAKKDRKLYLTEEELNQALADIEASYGVQAPSESENSSAPENDPLVEEPKTEVPPVEEDVKKEDEGALIDKDEFKAPENANEIEQPSGAPNQTSGPSIKEKAIEIVLSQKPIIMGSFVLEREKALAIITNICRELNNL